MDNVNVGSMFAFPEYKCVIKVVLCNDCFPGFYLKKFGWYALFCLKL